MSRIFFSFPALLVLGAVIIALVSLVLYPHLPQITVVDF